VNHVKLSILYCPFSVVSNNPHEYFCSRMNKIIGHFRPRAQVGPFKFYAFYRGTAGIIQLCNTARHNVVIIHVPIYHAFYYLMNI